MQNEMVKVLEPDAALPATDLVGDEGEAVHLGFDSEVDEAAHLADEISRWISDENLQPSRIGVLVSKQPNLYAADLVRELGQRGVPCRDEQSMQDLAKEPLFNLLNDYLRVLFGDRQARAYVRLYRYLIPSDLTPAAEYRYRLEWENYISSTKQELGQAGSLRDQVEEAVSSFISRIGVDFTRNLASEYRDGNYLDEVQAQCLANINQVCGVVTTGEDLVTSLDNDQAVRIMTIHKSKGLEFHSVVMLAVERETFWGDSADEASAFFVGISRAEKRLVLTSTSRRSRPAGVWRWDESRVAHSEFLGYLYNSKGSVPS
ncbi:3'-5' exonuclease [Pseudonocardia sp. TMWB2A]|uniref:3'-5' exonuclease n=1 Tax=Pseudonocardia sp. TMWB2A TaxID=687430 RepID=UPI00307EBE5D